MRLSRDRDFRAVFDARIRKSGGPLTLFLRPNDLPHHRLGLSIGRRVGNAVARNRLKRMIREAFRLAQHDLPRHTGGGYDIIVAARRHEPMPLERYGELLRRLAEEARRVHQRRSDRGLPAREGGAEP